MTTGINKIIDYCKDNNILYEDSWNNIALDNLDHSLVSNVQFNRYDLPLFKDNISSLDIHQGALGNCYLLAALSALSKNPYLIEKLIYKEGFHLGIIGIWFYYQGKWNMVIIDTQIPSKYGHPIFSYTDNEYWVMLIEKAWAKLNGNYHNTIGGNTKDVLHYLTNSVSCLYDLVDDSIEDMYNNGTLWNKILDEYNNGSILTTGGLKENLIENLTGEVDPSIIDDSNGGLIDNHAYSILEVREVNNNQLLKLYNPWGKYEWKGDWSDKDMTNWTNDMKNKLKYTDENDGCFWMNWKDYFENFSNLYITNDIYNHTIIRNGEWKEFFTCGGNKENWTNNPLYSIEWKDIEKTKMIINLSQLDTRINGGGNWLYIMLDIIQNTDNSLNQSRNDNNIIKTIHINSRIESIELDVDITKGKIWLIPSLWEEGRLGKFTLLVTSPNKFDLLEYQSEENKQLRKRDENMNCLTCNQLVDLTKPKFTFKQAKWHQDCYVCHNCNISLDKPDNSIYDIHNVNNNKYGGFCLKCYEDLYGDKCKHCSKTISRYDSFYNINGSKIHVDCYLPYMISISDKCEYCNEAICEIPNKYTGRYYTVNNKKIHSECYQKYMDSIAEKCIVCNTNIYDRYYSVSQGKFHIGCLDNYRKMISPTCILCNNQIYRQRYYSLSNNRAVHIKCYLNYINGI
jgi:hypothetical protein